MKKSKAKRRNCPVCQKKKDSEYWAIPGYLLSKCVSCGMVWDPFPSVDLVDQYRESYFNNENPKGGYANYFEGMAINKRTFSERLKRIEKRLGRKGKVLDVGCALGDFLLEAGRLGWDDPEGVEVSDYAYQFARRRGLKVKKGRLVNNNFPDNIFDLVTYQDVIEHVTDPVEELKKVYKILKPGGLLFIVTPNVGGFWSRVLGSLWYHYKPGEHVVYFSPKTMRKALKKAGFSDIETRSAYHVMSLEYIFNRLRYYSQPFFGFLLKISKSTPAGNIPFLVQVGEFEAWAQKQ